MEPEVAQLRRGSLLLKINNGGSLSLQVYTPHNTWYEFVHVDEDTGDISVNLANINNL